MLRFWHSWPSGGGKRNGVSFGVAGLVVFYALLMVAAVVGLVLLALLWLARGAVWLVTGSLGRREHMRAAPAPSETGEGRWP